MNQLIGPYPGHLATADVINSLADEPLSTIVDTCIDTMATTLKAVAKLHADCAVTACPTCAHLRDGLAFASALHIYLLGDTRGATG